MVMAQTKDLYAAIKDLKKNYKQVLREAVQYATDQAYKDVYGKAISCLEEYYSNYTPRRYDPRSDSLRHSFVPYKSINNGGTHVTSIVGVEYNSDILDSYVGDAYSASKKYGMVDGAWVIDNYLDGIHPRTDGSSVAGEAAYLPIVDKDSPTDKMDDYLDAYANNFSDNVYAYLAAYII